MWAGQIQQFRPYIKKSMPKHSLTKAHISPSAVKATPNSCRKQIGLNIPKDLVKEKKRINTNLKHFGQLLKQELFIFQQVSIAILCVTPINKSQGQTLKHCGLYLENECFSHGQFYVGASRVGSQKNLKFYAPENKPINIVYQGILQD